MAKANFHKDQRVYVKPVGTWAVIEKVKPQWVKDVEEPVRIYYDCGLGRDFREGELSLPEQDRTGQTGPAGRENWRLMRARNKWQDSDSVRNHPFPGTFPVAVTDEKDWGGWRVPGQEYDRDPLRIERQARMIASAGRMLDIIRGLAGAAHEYPGELPADVIELARAASALLRYVDETPGAVKSADLAAE
jgi:hypothetical protein